MIDEKVTTITWVETMHVLHADLHGSDAGADTAVVAETNLATLFDGGEAWRSDGTGFYD